MLLPARKRQDSGDHPYERNDEILIDIGCESGEEWFYDLLSPQRQRTRFIAYSYTDMKTMDKGYGFKPELPDGCTVL